MEHLAPFHGVLVNANLRRLQLAWAGSITAEWGYAVALCCAPVAWRK